MNEDPDRLRVVVAPDSFKESLGAADVAAAVRRGLLAADPGLDVVEVPMADGGEGTASALVAATGGRVVPCRVRGPLGDDVDASFGLLGDGETAVVELASASGLELVPPGRRDVLRAGTWGTGQLVAAALDEGASRIVVGIGGSATNDGGAGLLMALGARVVDASGRPVEAGGAALAGAAVLDLSGLDPRLAGVRLEAACDVDNPLLGPSGASAVFGPQKGAGADDVVTLDAALTTWADVLLEATGTDHRDVPGAGAAGGAGLALLHLGASLRPGVELVAEVVGLDRQVAAADLVITGEGRVDAQTAHGKTPAGVLAVARAADVPTVVLAGALGEGAEAVLEAGAVALLPVAHGPATTPELVSAAAVNLERTARSLAGLWLAGGRAARTPPT